MLLKKWVDDQKEILIKKKDWFIKSYMNIVINLQKKNQKMINLHYINYGNI